MIETQTTGRPRAARATAVFAAFSFRYDVNLVPALIENLTPIVDGWVSWDDRDAENAYSSEPARRSALIAAARKAGADWLLAVDPDERFENRLADEIRALTSTAEPVGWVFDARELYAPDAYRVDGIWGRKKQMRLFPLLDGVAASGEALHGRWVDPQARLQMRQTGLNLYHLRMILPERRRLRRDLYARLDPDRRYQAIGYDYLTDETDLQLETIPPGREFSPAHVEDCGLWAAAPCKNKGVPADDPMVAQLGILQHHRRTGNLQQAGEVAERLASRNPQVLALQAVRNAVALEAGAAREAVEIADALLRNRPEFTAGFWLKANALLASGRPVEAREWLSRLLTVDPGMIPADRLLHQLSDGADRFSLDTANWRRWVSGDAEIHEGKLVTAAEMAVVVIGLRAPQGLASAVKSIRAQDTAAEIVVVNSGGGDPIAVLAEHLDHIRLINVQERLYVGAARNIGIDASEGAYVAFLASDCRARQGWISGRLQRHHAGADAVSSAVVPQPGDTVVSLVSHLSLYAWRLPDTPPDKVGHFGVSYARRLFRRFGYFAPGLRIAEDAEFNRRIRPRSCIAWARDVQTIHPAHTHWQAFTRDMFVRGRRAGQHSPLATVANRPRFLRGLWEAYTQRTARQLPAMQYADLPPGVGLTRLRIGVKFGAAIYVLGALKSISRVRKSWKIRDRVEAAKRTSPKEARLAVELHPQNMKANLLLGQVLARKGRTGKAITALERANRLSPIDNAPVATLFRVFSKDKAKGAKLLRLCEDIALSTPHISQRWLLAARAAYRVGKFDRAELYALQALVSNPSNRSAYGVLADAQEASGRLQEAKQCRAFAELLKP
ncbi:tetratricopeptide repeat protein [Pseudoruegeria sp. HB172150]|uniref:tetratricopeptide repeat protein n=1 Tax=Pseudoruegeria sp. HB172150 TaxID=2721164 RepID=UPI001553DB85|nr:tetratricopeptide repeat protein [Pseudoruegeria sp. HB172150]